MTITFTSMAVHLGIAALGGGLLFVAGWAWVIAIERIFSAIKLQEAIIRFIQAYHNQRDFQPDLKMRDFMKPKSHEEDDDTEGAACELEALREAESLLGEIMKGEVNPEDEAEKFLRAYAPDILNQKKPKSTGEDQ